MKSRKFDYLKATDSVMPVSFIRQYNLKKTTLKAQTFYFILQINLYFKSGSEIKK